MISESKLIKQCLQGIRTAQKELFERYAPYLLGVCMRYTKNAQQAEDVLQEAFIRIFSGLKSFEEKSSLKTWMERIVINAAITHLKRNQKHAFQEDIETVEQYLPVEDVLFEASFTEEELLTVIRELPTGYQTVFNLYAIEGYKHREIAEMLEIDINTSKSQYSRSRKLIQERLTVLSANRSESNLRKAQ
jgi:RNA polymerase sigma factor (sigma-70 family)